MTDKSIGEKWDQLFLERQLLLEQLVAPAQAASNALQDAGMKKTADPLAEALFSVEVNRQASLALINDNPRQFATEIMARLTSGRQG